MHLATALRVGAVRVRRQRKPRPVLLPRRIELQYKADLLMLVRAMRAATQEQLLPVLRELESEYSYTRDAYGSRIEEALQRLAASFGGIGDLARRMTDKFMRALSAANAAQQAEMIRRAIGVDLGASLNALDIRRVVEAATVNNVQLIRSIPAQYVDKLQNLVLTNVAVGKRFESIEGEIQTLLDTTESRAKLIARDQTSKVNGQITEARQTALGIERYTWSTSGDERVREEHAALDGETFAWNDPPSEGHPGSAIACRCVALPEISLE